MFDELSLALALIDDVGLFALVSILIGIIERRVAAPAVRQAISGLLLGGAAVLAMCGPIPLAKGVFIDGRLVILALSGPVGGPLGATIAAAMAIAARLWMGGAGAVAGSVSIAAAAALGIIWCYARGCRLQNSNTIGLLLLGLLSSLSLLSMLLLPAETMPTIVRTAVPPLVVAQVLGTLILGSFITAERRRINLELALRDEVGIDPLTRVANRGVFDEALRFGRDRRGSGAPWSALLLLDIDHFKRVNDRHGHVMGDAVIVGIASAITSSVRDGDLVARYGGEEFAVLVRADGPEGATAIAERIRRAVAALSFRTPDGPLSVTASIGVAPLGRDEASRLAALAAADAALYRAKAAGRNRVEGQPRRAAARPAPTIRLRAAV